jgi:hypothetical protein
LKKLEPYFIWDEETGTAGCIITDKYNNNFYGTAICHEDDKDMCNKYTG